jgi:prevent-host-death family protein
MHIINIHDAKKHLSSLVEQAVKGDSFIIAKRGKPLVKVTRLDARSIIKRTGFMDGQIKVPDDFDKMGFDDINDLFEDK